MRTLKSFQVVGAVVQLILENENFISIVSKKRNKELCDLVSETFNISVRQSQRYIKEARQAVIDINKRDRQEWYDRAIRRKELLISKSMGLKDYRTAQMIDKDLCELLGLYPDKRIKQETTNIDIDLSKLTEKGLERIKHGDDPKYVMLDPESIRFEQ